MKIKTAGEFFDRKRKGGCGGERRKWTLKVSLFTDAFLSSYFTPVFYSFFLFSLTPSSRTVERKKKEKRL